MINKLKHDLEDNEAEDRAHSGSGTIRLRKPSSRTEPTPTKTGAAQRKGSAAADRAAPVPGSKTDQKQHRRQGPRLGAIWDLQTSMPASSGWDLGEKVEGYPGGLQWRPAAAPVSLSFPTTPK